MPAISGPPSAPDYADKKAKYFKKAISTCPNSLRVLQFPKWTLTELTNNHTEVILRIANHYGIRLSAWSGVGR